MKRALLAALVFAAACQGAVESSPHEEPDEDAGTLEDAGDAALPQEEDAAAPDAGPEVDPYRTCSPDGWCFEQPYPAAEDLLGAAHISAELSVLVGRRGRVLHLSPDGVRGVDSGTTSDLFAVQAFANGEAWAVGAANTFLRFDGESWSQHEVDAALPHDELHALWGASVDDVWAFGALGALWHYDGASWTKQTSLTGETLHAAWGASATRIYAVGHGATLLSYDGERWVAERLPGGGGPLAIHGSSESDIWAAAKGRMWHFDGSIWTDLMAPLGTLNVRALLAISPLEVYAAGDGGEAFRYDGTAWQPLTTGTSEPLHALAMESDRLLMGGAHGTLIAFDGAERITYSRGARDNLLDLSVGGTSKPWVVGDAVLRLASDGPEPVTSGTTRSLFGCYALDDELAWAVGTDGTIVRWDGDSMAPIDSGTDRWLRAVWAASPSSAWVVGERGTVLGLFNGTSWVPSPVSTTADLFDVWGAAADDVWIAGDVGTLLHWNGLEWSAQDAGTDVRLQSLWGRSADDVWMVGANGTILHWNGAALDVAQEGDNYALYGVWGDDDATYAVGSGGTMLRRAGDTWELEATPTDVTLFGVGRGADGLLRAVGADGVILVKP